VTGIDAAAAAGATDWAAFTGRLHPLVLHLPIGLLAATVLAELLALTRRDDGARRVRTLLLTATAASAAVAVVTGWLLSDEGGHAGRPLEWHRWLGVALAAVLLAVTLVQITAGRVRPRIAGTLRLGGLALAGGLSVLVGHLGGGMTHGRGHLTQHAPPAMRELLVRVDDAFSGSATADAEADLRLAAGPDSAAATDDLSVMLGALDAHCVRCHGAERRKSGLRLDTAAGLSSVLRPGNAPASELYRRVTLAAAHPDFMPPDEGAMSEAELAALRRWINDGANLEQVVAADQAVAEQSQAEAAIIEPVRRATGALIVTAGSPAEPGLRVDFGRGEQPVTPSRLAALASIADRIEELSLAGCRIEPGSVEQLPTMPAVTTVRLERSSVTSSDAAAVLGRTPAARRVNLYGTDVDAGVIDGLARLEHLSELFLAGTPLERDPGVAGLAARLPDVRLVPTIDLPSDPLADIPAFPADEGAGTTDTR